MKPNATINPICCICQEQIGEMPIDIYITAIKLRGDYLFCPTCRQFKCDSCGYFFQGTNYHDVKDEDGKFLGRACDTCFQFVLPDELSREDFPNFRTMQPPNLQFVQFHTVSPELETRWDER